MQSSPLASILSPQAEPIATSHSYWDEIGVDKCYCMLITGRCGSTLLTKLVSAINIFGQPEEYFTEEMLPHLVKRYGTSDFLEILTSVASSSSPGRTFGFQVDPIRLSWVQAYWDLSSAFKSSLISLVVMKRYDLLAQAYSYLVSKKSGKWHIFSDKQPGAGLHKSDSFMEHCSPDQMDQIGNELLGELLLILRNEKNIQNLLADVALSPLVITYEELLSDRFYVIFKLFRSLGASKEVMEQLLRQKSMLSLNPTLKNPYGYKEKLVDHLYSKHPSVLDSLNSLRCDLLPEIESIISW